MQLGRNRRRRSVAAVMLCGSALVAAVLAPTDTTARAAPEPASSGKIEPELTETLTATGGTDFWIRMGERADTSEAREIDDWADRGRAVLDELTRTAQESRRRSSRSSRRRARNTNRSGSTMRFSSIPGRWASRSKSPTSPP